MERSAIGSPDRPAAAHEVPLAVWDSLAGTRHPGRTAPPSVSRSLARRGGRASTCSARAARTTVSGSVTRRSWIVGGAACRATAARTRGSPSAASSSDMSASRPLRGTSHRTSGQDDMRDGGGSPEAGRSSRARCRHHGLRAVTAAVTSGSDPLSVERCRSVTWPWEDQRPCDCSVLWTAFSHLAPVTVEELHQPSTSCSPSGTASTPAFAPPTPAPKPPDSHRHETGHRADRPQQAAPAAGAGRRRR
ncbi:hypothetical protein P3T39_007197 [Kitasatospora sp. GP82]|nr:hypothetical protein [Kitasatospora sp. GP82]